MKNENELNKINLTGYYDRTYNEDGEIKPKFKKYKKLLFKAGDGLQSSELNELQSMLHIENSQLASKILTSGDFVSGGNISNTPTTLICGESCIYLASYYIDIPERTIPFVQADKITTELGIVATHKIVTHEQDTDLTDPARETRNYNRPGAARLAITGEWKLRGECTPEELNNFNRVFNIVEGNLVRSESDLPWEKGVKELVARYDRNSNGNYIINGYQLTAIPETKWGLGPWNINISEGNANIYGYNYERNFSQILELPKLSDNGTQLAEPVSYRSAVSGGFYKTRHTPISEIKRISGEKKVVDEVITHGNFKGASDPLRNSPVTLVISVSDNSKTYNQGTDYILTNDKIEWLPTAANEPSPGSTYKVTYRYQHTTDPSSFETVGGKKVGSLNDTHDEVFLAGFDEGTTVRIDYEFTLPRVDKVFIDRYGLMGYIKGEPKEFNPSAPNIDLNGILLELGTVYLTAYNEPIIEQSTLKVYKMSDIGSMLNAIRAVEYNVSKLALKENIRANQPTANFKNMIVDDFNDDNNRDAGKRQSAQCIGGNLVLDIAWDNKIIEVPNTNKLSSFTLEKVNTAMVFEQNLHSKDRTINEFTYASVPAAVVTVEPSKYTWIEKETYQELQRSLQESSVVQNRTQNFDNPTTVYREVRSGSGLRTRTNVTNNTVTRKVSESSVSSRESINTTSSIASSVTPYETVSKVPQIQLKIESNELDFDNGEIVEITIDNLPAGTLTANPQGKISGTITTPEKLYSGFRQVVIKGKTNGKVGATLVQLTPMQKNVLNTVTEHWRWNTVTTTVNEVTHEVITNIFKYDPTAQTFVLNKDIALDNVEVYFTKFPTTFATAVICETSAGVPNPHKVIMMKGYKASELPGITSNMSGGNLTVNSATKFTFDVPRTLYKNVEYALIIICDDNVGRLQTAKLGDRDDNLGKWIYSNPYTAGTLLHSSNLKAWTPIQDEDMRFRLNSAKFKNKTEIDLGSINVTDVTDVMLMTTHEVREGTAVIYYMTITVNSEDITRPINPYIHTGLEMKYTGPIKFKAELISNSEDISPYIDTSVQVALGKSSEVAEYISRSFDVDGTVFDAYLDYYEPTGTRVEMFYDNGSNPIGEHTDGREWVKMEIKAPSANNIKQIGSGYVEAHFRAENVNITPHSVTNKKISRVKIKLTTTNMKVRPVCSNLRFTVQSI